MKRPTKLLATVYILGLIAFFTIFILISGCSQAWYQRRDIKKLDALAIQQQTEFLRLSNQINPCFNGKAKSDTVTVFGPGDTVFKAGKAVVIREHDTVKITQHDTLKITKPVTKTIHDTVPDTRAIASLQAQYTACTSEKDKSDTKLSDAQATAKKLLYFLIGLVSLDIIVIAIKVYKFFSGGAVANAAKGASDIIKKL